MPLFTFNTDTHQYHLGSERLISVTEVFKLCGLVDTTWMTDSGRDRGTAVHTAIQYLIEGDLDFDSLHPKIQPYLKAIQHFILHTDFKPLLQFCERPMFHPRYKYAGKPDLIGSLRHKLVLLEIKTGSFACVELQTAAYANLPELASIGVERYRLQLLNNGDYRLVPIHGAGDFHKFLEYLGEAQEIIKRGNHE
jgi:hypothetical protein